MMMALDLLRVDGREGWKSEGRRNERRSRGGMFGGARFSLVRDEDGRWSEGLHVQNAERSSSSDAKVGLPSPQRKADRGTRIAIKRTPSFVQNYSHSSQQATLTSASIDSLGTSLSGPLLRLSGTSAAGR